MRKLALTLCLLALAIGGCSDDDGSSLAILDKGNPCVDGGSSTPCFKDTGTIGDAFVNPCPKGLCTPPGGGDMMVWPDSGPYDVGWLCGAKYPVSCGSDLKCAAKSLCGGVQGTVSVKSCTFTCLYQ